MGIKASEKEKERIGKELHDGIASSIIKLVHEIENKDIDLADKLLKTYKEVRDLSHQLDNTPLHNEFFLERLIEIIPEKTNKNFILKIKPTQLIINEPKGTHIYRIIQELITNNLKYSNATEIKISIQHKEENILLKYFENSNFSPKIKKGNGLKNIQDRVKIMLGKININYKTGFLIEIIIPYKK